MNLRPHRRTFLLVALGVATIAAALAARQYLPAVRGTASADLQAEEVADDAFPGAAFSSEATENDFRQAAIDVAAALVRAYPQAPAALDVQAKLDLSLGDSSAAVALWRRCIERDPQFATAYYGLGYVAKEKGDFEEAVELFRKVAVLDPSDTRAPAMLGESLLKLGRMEEAASELERCLRAGPPTAVAVTSLGHAYLALGRLEEARRAFEAAAHDAPEDKAPHYGLATVYARMGEPENARQAMQEFQRLNSLHRDAYVSRMRTFGNLTSMHYLAVETHLEAGRVYLRHGNAQQAEDLWRRAAALDPKDTECRRELARLYEQGDRSRDALRVCRQLRKLEPRNADYAISFALIHARLGRIDEALTIAEEAIQLAPDNPRYREAYEAIRRAGGRP